MQPMHRLQPEQLRLDHPLPWNVFDAAGQLLLCKGFVIERDVQIEHLLARGMYVHLDELGDFNPHQHARPFDPLARWESIQARLAALLKSLPRDGRLQAEFADLAHQAIELSERAPDLVLAALTLREQRNYPVAHCMHCALVADMVARKAGWDGAQRVTLAAAALSMNVAMIELQARLYNHRGALNFEQRGAVQQHPSEGARLLIELGVQDDEWLRAVLEHHESPDGRGYPRRATNPSEAAMLLHTVDVFTAKVSPRAHRSPMIASEATRDVFKNLSCEGRNPFPRMLVSEVGIYPPGTIVRLANGEVGVSCRRGAAPKTPLVAVLIAASGMPMLQPVVRNAALDAAHAIVGVQARDATLVGLNFELIWGRTVRV